MAAHSNTLARRIPWTGTLVGYSPQRHKDSGMTEWLSTIKCFSLEELELILYYQSSNYLGNKVLFTANSSF